MQYTPHYNLNLPEGTDIVNPLVQDNPNYSAIDTALYDNKLRAIGNATHVKTGTNHAITLADSDIVAFKFVATGDYVTGDTFTVDGVTVTARISDGSSIPNEAFKVNSTVLCILDGTLLNLINISNLNVNTINNAIADLTDDVIVLTDSLNLGDLAAGAHGYTQKTISVPAGYSLMMATSAPSRTGIVSGRIILNTDVAGNDVYISYYSTAAFSSPDTGVAIKALLKKN